MSLGIKFGCEMRMHSIIKCVNCKKGLGAKRVCQKRMSRASVYRRCWRMMAKYNVGC